MASTPIEVYYDPGKTLTCNLYPRGSDTASFTGRSLTEETNRDGVYKCNVTEALSGYYTVHVIENSRTRAIYDIYMLDDTATKYAQSVGDALPYLYMINVITPMANNVSSVKTKTDQLAFGTANRVNAQVYGMQNDVITAAAHDESTAYPLKSADSGSTQIARVGADGDTLETLSDQIDGLNDLSAAEVNAEVDTALSDYDAPTASEMTAAFTEIKGATWSTTDTLEAIRNRGDAAWTTADVSGLATLSALATVDSNVDAILVDTGTTIPAQISGLNNFDPANDTVAHVTLVDTTTTNTDMRGTDSAFLASSAPANFGDLAITSTTGLVSVGTNNDKTGYSISGTITTLDALDAAQDAQHSTTQSAISALNDLSAAEVNAEVDTALSDYDGPTKTEMDSAFTEIKGATWSSVTDTLEAIRDRGDSAWITATGFSTHSAADVRTEMDSNSTQLAAIVADTNELQTNQGDWATADVSGLATAAALATVDANVDSILVDTGTSIPATLTTILADTNELQTNQGDWATADVSGLATAAALATVDSNVDAILVDTGTTLPATLATILADTNELQTNQGDWATADVSGLATAAALATVDSNVDSILTDTGTTIPAQISGLNDLSAADVNAQVDIALSDYDGPTKNEMDAAFTEIKGATWSSSTDTLEAIRNRGDAAWTTATSSTVVTALGLYGAALESTLSDVYAFTDATLTVVNGLNDISASDVLTQATSAINTYDPPTKTEMDAAFTEIKGATWNSSTDTLEEIRDNVGGGGGGGDATEAKQDTIIAAIGALNDISAADVIDYDMGNGRTVAEALAPLRNKWTIASGVYTVYDTDDTTVLWTASSVQTAGDPTSSIDPV